MIVLVLVYLLIGLLFVGLGVPLLRRRVPPNPWYGFRTPRTLRDPAVWYPANAYTGRLMLAVGVVTIVTSLALLAIQGLSVTAYALILAAVMCVGVLVIAALSFVHLRTLDRS